MPAVGDQALGAVHHVVVAVVHCLGLDGLHVAAGIGFGDADAAPFLAGGHLGKVGLFLLLGAVGGDHVGHDQVGVQDAAQAHPTPADLLDDQGVGADVQSQAAVFLGDDGAEQPQLLHAFHEFEGILVVVFHLLSNGTHFPAHKFSDGVDDAALGFGQRGQSNASRLGLKHFSTG